MTRLTADAELLTRLLHLKETLEVCDEQGRPLAYVLPAIGLTPTASTDSPFTDAEIRERRQQRIGRPLCDILKDLQAS